MVEKKLNFNQPILSVRRNSPSLADQRKSSNALPPTIHWLRPHGPEPKSGPVRNPGSVPFIWEQIPGRPKEEILAQCRDLGADPPRYHLGISNMFDEDMEVVPRTTRFLDETSRYTSEQSWSSDSEDCSSEAVVEQPREQRRKVVNQERPVQLHCRPNFDKCMLHYSEKEGRDEHDQNVITICCLLPRSCLRSAICNVNPVTAMSVLNRVVTFPASRTLSATSLSSENEYKEHAPRKKSFKTLQELLSDEGGLKVLTSIDCAETVKKVEDGSDTSEEMNMGEDSDQDCSREEDTIRAAVNSAKQKLSRAKTLGDAHNLGVAPPPLPESPSDSWLSRAVSEKKASSSASMSRFSNKLS